MGNKNLITMSDEEFCLFCKQNEHDNDDKTTYFDRMENIANILLESICGEDLFIEFHKRYVTTLCMLSGHVFSMPYNNNTTPLMKVRLPGCHDFNACIYSYNAKYRYDNFINFYIPFVNDIMVIIKSKGTIYPKFIHSIKTYTNNDIRQFSILRNILLIGNEYDDMPNVPKFAWRQDPYGVYYICEPQKIATLDKYEQMYHKMLDKTKKFDELWKEFVDGEYKILSFIKEHGEDLLGKYNNAKVTLDDLKNVKSPRQNANEILSIGC